MSDSDPDSGIPSWQRENNNAAEPMLNDDDKSSESTAANASEGDDLDIARRFLEDEEVKSATLEKKKEFLQSKGIKEEDIETLLAESPTTAQSPTTSDAPPSTTSSLQPRALSTQFSTPASERPPIVTYPEFLTKPIQQPPLVTRSAILTTGSILAGFAALIHGTSRYVLSPMLETQTDAREEFHEATSSRLNALVSKLESTVSTIPLTGPAADAESEAGDPTEMFHRDMGTQTTPADTGHSRSKSSGSTTPTPVQMQADNLNKLNRNLAAIKKGLQSQTDDTDDIKTLIDVFRDDLDAMVYGGQGGHYDMTGSGASYGLVGRKAEPEDEIKKVKDSVRRVKGALLSTKSFPSKAY